MAKKWHYISLPFLKLSSVTDIFNPAPIYLLLIVSCPNYIVGEGSQAENFVWKKKPSRMQYILQNSAIKTSSRFSREDECFSKIINDEEAI